MTNLEASNKVANWKVIEEVDSKADHNYIKYAINKKIEIENEIPKRNLRKMNKSVYANYIEEKLAETSELENMNIEEKNLFLVTVMEEAIDASCPLIRPNIKVNKPWWDKELGIQNEELNELKRRIIKMRDQGKEEEKQRLKDLRTELMDKYGKLMKRKKRENWKAFTNEFATMSDTEKLAKIIKSSQTNFMQTLKTKNGNFTKDPKETLKCLLERHFPDKSEDEMLDGNHYQVTEEEIYKIKDFITVNKIKEDFKSFKPIKVQDLME